MQYIRIVTAVVGHRVSAAEKLLRKMKFMKVTIHLGCYGSATPKAAPRTANILEGRCAIFPINLSYLR